MGLPINTNTMTIGDKIRKVRELRGYKQEYVAGQLGLSITAYGNIVRGDSRLSFERLEQIARVLEVSAPQLLTLAEACWLPGVVETDASGYHAALRALEQLAHSLQADIDHLRRQNEQLTRLLGQRAGAEPGPEEGTG